MAWYRSLIRNRIKTTTSEERQQWEKRADSQAMTFDKVCGLFYPEAEIDKDAQVANFLPRSADDVNYQKLLKYARDDVHILLRVVMIIKKSCKCLWVQVINIQHY